MGTYHFDLTELTFIDLLAIRSGQPPLIIPVLDKVVIGGVLELPFSEYPLMVHELIDAIELEVELLDREKMLMQYATFPEIFNNV